MKNIKLKAKVPRIPTSPKDLNISLSVAIAIEEYPVPNKGFFKKALIALGHSTSNLIPKDLNTPSSVVLSGSPGATSTGTPAGVATPDAAFSIEKCFVGLSDCGGGVYFGPPPPIRLTVNVATVLCLSSGEIASAKRLKKIITIISFFCLTIQKRMRMPQISAKKETLAAVIAKSKNESPDIPANKTFFIIFL